MQKPLKDILVKNEIMILSEFSPHIVCLSSTFTSNALNPKKTSDVHQAFASELLIFFI